MKCINIFTEWSPPPNQRFRSLCFIFNRYLKSSAIYLHFLLLCFWYFFLWLLLVVSYILLLFGPQRDETKHLLGAPYEKFVARFFSRYFNVRVKTMYFTRTIVKEQEKLLHSRRISHSRAGPADYIATCSPSIKRVRKMLADRFRRDNTLN